MTSRTWVQWIEAGPKHSSVIGDSLKGGSWLLETYDGGRVGLKDGSVRQLKTVTLIFWMGRDLSSVEGS